MSSPFRTGVPRPAQRLRAACCATLTAARKHCESASGVRPKRSPGCGSAGGGSTRAVNGHKLRPVAPRAGLGDVTIQQQTQFDFAVIKAHGTRTETTTTDKRRSDSDMHCEGLMSMFCGDTQTGEIIRLDRDVEW